MKGKKKSTKKKAADDVKVEELIPKTEKSLPEESEEGVTDKSAAPDKKTDESAKEKEEAELKT